MVLRSIRRVSMSIKTSISMPDIVFFVATKKAELLFGGNFSSYISWLISMDNIEQMKEATKTNPSNHSI